MEKRSGVDAVHHFWEQVWRSPQNFATFTITGTNNGAFGTEPDLVI
jgi:hypothetical protein